MDGIVNLLDCQCEQSPLNKRSRSESTPSPPSPSVNEPIQATTITGLNDDCLEKILRYFDLQNLFNVAVANESLQPAANVVYKRIFGAKEIHLFRAHGLQKSPELLADPNTVKIFNFRTSLQFLRVFGASITNLTITYGQSASKRYTHLHQYINKYCESALITIKFCGQLPYPIEHFDKIFVNVQTVDIADCDLGAQCQAIFEWFPSLRNLSLHANVSTHPAFTAVAPFQLERLNIEFNGKNCMEFMERYRRIGDILQSNGQLQSLTIKAKCIQMTMNFLLDIIRDHRSISSLVVNTAGSTRVNISDIRRLAAEHPMLMEVDLPFYRFDAANAIKMIQLVVSLKKFCFRVQSKKVFVNITAKVNGKWHGSFKGGSYVTLIRQQCRRTI